ncbi:hypothetical protein SNR37_003558 [Agarivorans aestuarii]|uniref:DUF2946 domain-containing protein n=1 Tax=Agarivorans aestuarii TaxID=1563703 RepID=A0ABU7G4I2_9ALTE|nr:hypothetical protein [Agarivorans aestuarii]MEE1674126.1 hypothetical protein [Agarivorans aestuarii]
MLSLARLSIVVYTVLAFALTSINVSASQFIEPQSMAEEFSAISHSTMQDCHVDLSAFTASNNQMHAHSHTMPIGASCCTVSCMAPPLMNLFGLNIAESPSSLLAFLVMRSIAPTNTAEPLYRPPIS